MTKYSEEFKKEVRNYYSKGKLIKKYNHDKSFTFVDVANKFNLTVEQVRTVLYNKKGNNSPRQASQWQKPNWSKPKDKNLFNGKFIDDPRAENYDKYGN
tara:strand:- start:981 stop:1277 length:297 start_codon:yes stop_codon:yes gene_type:complete